MPLSAIVSKGACEKQSGEVSRSWPMVAKSCCKRAGRSSAPAGPSLKQRSVAPSSRRPAPPPGEEGAVGDNSFLARWGRGVVLTLLAVYKGGISPLLPSFCKFYPTCSVYAMEAVERHGVGQGLWLAAKRVLRCRPFSPGGHDPVPDA